MIHLLILLLFSATLSQSTVFERVKNTIPDALCLDGSPADYYLSFGSKPDTIVINFDNGDWCGGMDLNSTLEKCLEVSRTDKGSSNNWNETILQNEGIYSKSVNNFFVNATKVKFPFCDGAGHQGYRKSPINYKGQSIYFRGHSITQSRLDSLEAKIGIFSFATKLYIVGQGAGGIAALQWANYIRNKAKADTIVCVIDSAIFFNIPNFSGNYYLNNFFTNLLKLSNAQITPPLIECITEQGNDQVDCMFISNIYKYVNVPLFFVQSMYDKFAIELNLGILCLKGASLEDCSNQQINYIESYHKNVTNILNNISALSGQNGYWAISCVQHEFVDGQDYSSNLYRIPMKSNISIEAAINSWAKKERVTHKHLDKVNWPDNIPCSKLEQLHLKAE